ncbi:MAG: DUF1311 domain-containing protein [Alphaproteobacteria bacterium]|nr:DUF1311 domain-containing protein [Alphaproteobacteria bacterium]
MTNKIFYRTFLLFCFTLCAADFLCAQENKILIQGGVYAMGKESNLTFFHSEIGTILTCKEYHMKGSPDPTYVSQASINANFAFIRQCDTLEILAGVKIAKNNYIDSNITLKNIELIPAKMLLETCVSSNEYFDGLEKKYKNKTVADLIKDKEYVVLESTDTFLKIAECPKPESIRGDEMDPDTIILEEIARGDFTHSGYQEILCKVFSFGGGTADMSSAVILRRLSKDGKLYAVGNRLNKEELLAGLLGDNIKLKNLDNNLNASYKILLSFLDDKSKTQLLQEQRNWLKKRNQHLDSVEKLQEIYQERISTLLNLRQQSPERIKGERKADTVTSKNL